MNARRVTDFVESLRRNRRPKPFTPEPDDVEAMRAAIELNNAEPAAALPRAEFVSDLHRRLGISAVRVRHAAALPDVDGRSKLQGTTEIAVRLGDVPCRGKYLAPPRVPHGIARVGCNQPSQISLQIPRFDKDRFPGFVYAIDGSAKRLKELEKENGRLKKAVADLTLDKQILHEALRGNG